MLFGWFRRRDPTAKRWLELAKKLDLERAESGETLIADMLDLPVDADVGPVFRVPAADRLETYLFYYRVPAAPRSRTAGAVTGCLLVGARPLSPVSWRATRKVHEVIASLQASATGGEVLSLPEAPDFDDKVTIVARFGERLAARLTQPVRRTIERALFRLEPAPVLTVGEDRILLTALGSEIAFDAAEYLLSDVLSLYAALEAN